MRTEQIQEFEIIAKGIVFSGPQSSSCQSATFPSVTVLSTGRWICTFRVSPDKQCYVAEKVFLTWSDDEGRTWSDAYAPFTPPIVDGRPGSLRMGYCTALGGAEVLMVLAWVDHSDPTRPFFDPTTESLLDMKIFSSKSSNGGETWSELIPVPSMPADAAVPLTGPILVMQDGTWLCQYETNKPYGAIGSWHHTSRLIFSKDQGLNWNQSVKVTGDPANRLFYWDQRPAVMPDGTLLDLFWTYDNHAAAYINIHASESCDGGKTWSQPWDTTVPGQPAQPVGLPNKQVVMVYIDRTDSPTIKVRLSKDGGRSWPIDTEQILVSSDLRPQTIPKNAMEDAWSEMGAFSMGLPAAISYGKQDIVIVYYKGETTDRTGIEWLRIRINNPQLKT